MQCTIAPESLNFSKYSGALSWGSLLVFVVFVIQEVFKPMQKRHRARGKKSSVLFSGLSRLKYKHSHLLNERKQNSGNTASVYLKMNPSVWFLRKLADTNCECLWNVVCQNLKGIIKFFKSFKKHKRNLVSTFLWFKGLIRIHKTMWETSLQSSGSRRPRGPWLLKQLRIALDKLSPHCSWRKGKQGRKNDF